MVVGYPSGAEASALSFFTTMPKILFWASGSIIPSIFPQVVLAVGHGESSRLQLLSEFVATDTALTFWLSTFGCSVCGVLSRSLQCHLRSFRGMSRCF